MTKSSIRVSIHKKKSIKNFSTKKNFRYRFNFKKFHINNNNKTPLICFLHHFTRWLSAGMRAWCTQLYNNRRARERSQWKTSSWIAKQKAYKKGRCWMHRSSGGSRLVFYLRIAYRSYEARAPLAFFCFYIFFLSSFYLMDDRCFQISKQAR